MSLCTSACACDSDASQAPPPSDVPGRLPRPAQGGWVTSGHGPPYSWAPTFQTESQDLGLNEGKGQGPMLRRNRF